MRSVDENKAALLELGSSPAMWRMLETMPHPSEEFGLWLIHWSSISAIASRMSNTPTIDELNDWGTILNSKGSEHFNARRYQIVQQACPSNEAKYVTLAVYAAHGGDLDHPLVEENTPPLWIQHTRTVSSMDLPPSTQIEHALLVIQQWTPTSSAQPLELVLPGVSESSGFV